MNSELILSAFVLAAVQITLTSLEISLKQPFLLSSITWTLISSGIMFVVYGLTGMLVCLVFNLALMGLLWWRLSAVLTL